MALYHFSVSQIKRSAGQSVLAAAAYRAGERLYSEYYDEISDYTRKGGVLHTEILLPAHAPECFRDRATLWNAVEATERHPKAQLAYSFDIALQNELSLNENIELARAFVQKEFVDRGMIADLAIHSPDKTGGIPNPHIHVMTTMRPLNPDGSFAPKQRREYVLDASGNRIRGSDGRCRFNAVHTTDWHSPERLESWRTAWCNAVNARFEEKGIPSRIDHRSYARQSVEQIPTVHEGPNVRKLEQKGIRTEKGELNRWIRSTNKLTRTLKTQIAKLLIIDPIQAFLGAQVDMNRANEVRPIFRALGEIAEVHDCAILMIGHLNKASGSQSTYRGLGSIDMTAAVHSLLFIGKVRDDPTTRVLTHEKSSLAPPGKSLAFSLGDAGGFRWLGEYQLTADELLSGSEHTPTKVERAEKLILSLLENGRICPSSVIDKAAQEQGISPRTVRSAKRNLTSKLYVVRDGTQWMVSLLS